MEEAEKFMTPAERLAAHLTGTASPIGAPATRQVTMRLPVGLLANIEAICAATGLNRTQVAGMLLAAGASAVFDQLPADRVVELSESVAAYTRDLESGVI